MSGDEAVFVLGSGPAATMIMSLLIAFFFACMAIMCGHDG